MNNSKQIGRLVGPAIIAMVASETPLVQPHLYDAQTAPTVYLSGTVVFISGLAIVLHHHHWRRNWQVLITISGWFFLFLGLVRMFGATSYTAVFSNVGQTALLIIECLLFCIGLVITFKSYRKEKTVE